ncbi:MAG TPA: alpha/beta fold hydrolase [Gemmatimonadaceae bacterium]|nr:alpha/beta fold hydrolase [Gemmatimonadaceae bacterium]
MLSSSACAFVTGASPAVIAPPPAALDAENVIFQSESGSQIHAWLVRGHRGGGAVLLLHGVGSNRSSMEGRAAFLHGEGFTVLAPDFQAHGESPGRHTTFGALESLDAEAAMSFLRDVAPGEKIGVIGVSMGGAATLLGHGPLTADAFVLESMYPSIRNAVGNRLGTWLGPLGSVGRHFTSTAIRIIGSQTGVTEAELQPISRIGAIHAPLLLLSGTADRYTPLAEAESLFVHAVSPKTFWPVSGAAHEDLYAYAKGEYSQRVGGFLEQYLRTEGGSSTETAKR